MRARALLGFLVSIGLVTALAWRIPVHAQTDQDNHEATTVPGRDLSGGEATISALQTSVAGQSTQIASLQTRRPSPTVAGGSASDMAAVDVLPDATKFGDGWTLYATRPGTSRDSSIRDSALRIYGGPRGARVVVTVFSAWDNMSSRLHIWLAGNSLFEYFRDDISGVGLSQESDLEMTAPPMGCSQARRGYGDETLGFSMFPVGLTLCEAANSDVVLMVFTSGEVAGKTGVDASDAVTELTLRLFDDAMKAKQEAP